jgi:uncharacterized protein YijF (DUF1287 family)
MTITQTLVGSGTNDTILFTATAETAVLTAMFANTSASSVNITVHVSTGSNAVANAAVSNQIVTLAAIPAYDTLSLPELGKFVLDASNTIQAFASTSNVVTATIVTRVMP